ncbi:MAG: MFS transporter [Aigarchaeota archaeon]|nr:MFS transporter [Aigarchaeota archaeon]MDW8021155.1 MFS transporter [Nitrososphaerota archaeon]
MFERSGLRSHLILALGFIALYASIASFTSLWPFMVEIAGVDSASYGGFLGLGNLLSLAARFLAAVTNNLGAIIFVGAFFSAAASLILIPGYTYYSIMFSTLFQKLSFEVSRMGREVTAGMTLPRNWRGVFAAIVLSSTQLGILIGVNLGLMLFLLTRSYLHSLILGMVLAALSAVILTPLWRMKLFQENFSPRLLIPSRKPVKILLIICILDAFIWGGVFEFAYVLAPSYLGAVEADIGLARTLGMIIVIPTNLFFGAVSDKLQSRKFFMIISELLGCVALLCYAMMRSPISIVIFGALMGLVSSTWIPLVIALFTEMTPQEELGAALSSWSILTGASRIIYPVVGGFLIERLGVQFFFELSAIMLLMISALIAVALEENR